jgi:preprotein translocase subunit SecA
LNRQRQAIYDDRRHILEGDNISEQVHDFIEKTIRTIITEKLGELPPEDWDLEALWTELKTLYPVSITVDELMAQLGSRPSVDEVLFEVLSDVNIAYGKRESTLGEAVMRELERRVVLSVIDRRWRDHLYEMDYLKDGIGLRAMAQRDPLVEYQREGYSLFQGMMGQIREDTTGYIFNLEVQIQQPTAQVGPIVSAKGLMEQAPQQGLSYSAPTADGEVEVRNQSGQVVQSSEQTPASAFQRQAQPASPASPPGPQAAPAARPGAAAPRGAFGQSAPTQGGQPAGNRAQRRAAKKRKK